jgi:DNA-binding transcriptional LysR family regulator
MRFLNERQVLFVVTLCPRRESRSFSVAGREMGVWQPTATRIVYVLEKQIGVALLVRTKRAVTLTKAGSNYLTRIEPS